MSLATFVGEPYDWHEDAACRDLDPGIFFPRSVYDHSRAIAICEACPVREPCLDYAVTNFKTSEDEGIWGGTTPNYRAALRRGDEFVDPVDAGWKCSVDDCESEKDQAGFCAKHYRRWYIHGDPTVKNSPGRKRVLPDDDELLDLFLDHTNTEIADMFDVKRQTVNAHRSRLVDAGGGK